MRRVLVLALSLVTSSVASYGAFARPDEGPRAEERAPPDAAVDVLATILHDNAAFAKAHGVAHFERFAKEQHPRATVVACADSRVHTRALELEPDGDLYVVRNIGNQIDATAGSVEYGVRHLHTPLLLVVGHVGCGAVRAAFSDYRAETPAIRHELDGLHLSILHVERSPTFEETWRRGVFENVHQQVENAMHEYEAEVMSGDLLVVGVVYDFTNELARGHGKLTIINVNGERDRAQVDAHPVVKSALLKAHLDEGPRDLAPASRR